MEDLTAMNVKLMNRLKNLDHVKNNWSVNGKIYCVTDSGKKIKVDLFDDIEAKIREIN